MIKIWANDFFHIQGRDVPDYTNPALAQQAYNSNLARLASLEAIGFEGVFFTEHHFLSALSPNPNLLIAALARMTKRLRLGVMGNVLPYHQPWRLAEDLAMLDYITEGRLEIGMASGVAPEFVFLKIPPDDIRPMFAEAQEFIDKASRDCVVSHHGKYYNYDEIHLMPRPRQETRRRHWQTVYTPETCRKAARNNYKVCTGFQSTDQAAIAFEAYRDEAAKAGIAVGPDDIAVRRQVLVWHSDTEAEAMNKELIETARMRTVERFKPVNERLAQAGTGMSEGVKQSGVIDADSAPRPAAAPRQINPLAAGGRVSIDDEFICGTPRTVADKIIDQCRKMGAGNLLAYHAIGLTQDELDQNYGLWREVLPLLQKAGSQQPAKAEASVTSGK